MDKSETAVVTEDVARAVHAAWMKERLADGWRHGKKRVTKRSCPLGGGGRWPWGIGGDMPVCLSMQKERKK